MALILRHKQKESYNLNLRYSFLRCAKCLQVVEYKVRTMDVQRICKYPVIWWDEVSHPARILLLKPEIALNKI